MLIFKSTSILIIVCIFSIAGISATNPERPYDTSLWGDVNIATIDEFHFAYDLLKEGNYIDAIKGFSKLTKIDNYFVADEAKWYLAESMLISETNIELTLQLYLDLAFDKNSNWFESAKDKLNSIQFKHLIFGS